jgi:hypothetical protein
MSTNSKPRFRRTLECLENRELLSGNPFTVPVLPSVPAQVRQFANQMQGNFNADRPARSHRSTRRRGPRTVGFTSTPRSGMSR